MFMQTKRPVPRKIGTASRNKIISAAKNHKKGNGGLNTFKTTGMAGISTMSPRRSRTRRVLINALR
jgi:hypothetical protein